MKSAAEWAMTMPSVTRPKSGASKLLPRCTLPLTGRGVVNRVITELAVVDVTPRGFALVEVAPGVTVEQVKAATAAPLLVGDVKTMPV